MITLTLITEGERLTLTTDKKTVTIGSNPATDTHLHVNAEGIGPEHVKIVEEAGKCWVINRSDDPFTSIDEEPFGKKAILDTCTIEIDQTKIKCQWVKTEEKEEIQEPCLENIFEQIEDLGPPIEVKNIPVKEEKPAIETTTTQEEMETYGDKWKILTSILFTLIMLSTAVASSVYFKTSGNNNQEEKKIAAAVADISMAISHAMLKNIKPVKQNWSDPAFIEKNLHHVLSPNLHSQVNINNEGKFTQYPYILRLYTTSNLSHFLIIAQPSPGLMQSFIQKNAIVLSSTSMEIRKLSNLKGLNRLLARQNPLDGKNGKEISKILTEGELVPLPELAGNKNQWCFTTPKNLSSKQVGAKNYIYNAPRYYPFTEKVLKRAISSYENGSGIYEIKQDLKTLAQFRHLIFYTSKGLPFVVDAKKALDTLYPKNDFILAYLKFNEKGYVTKSELLLSEEDQTVAMVDENLEPYQTDKKPDDRIDLLTPLQDEIIFLLVKQTKEPLEEFEEQLHTAVRAYIEKDPALQENRNRIAEITALDDLDEEELFTPEDIIEEEQQVEQSVEETIEELPEIETEKLQEAESLQELEHFLEEFEQLPEDKLSSKVRAQIQTLVLNRITFFLFSDESLYQDQAIDEMDRESFVHILTSPLIDGLDEEEYEYFLDELDNLSA